MAFVAISLSVGTAIGLGTGTAAILGGGALIGAGVGGLYSAITGDGDILNSMLTGGLLGGAGAYGIGAMGGGGAGVQGAMAGPFFGGTAPLSTAAIPSANVATTTAATEAAALLDAAAVTEGGAQAGMATQYAAQETAAKLAAEEVAKKTALNSGMKTLGYGLAGTTALSLLGGKKGTGAGVMPDPGMVRPYEYSSTPNDPTGIYPSPYATAEYTEDGNPILDTRERNYFSQNFTPLQPYSARSGTVNPNEPLQEMPQMAATGGLLFDDESGMDDGRGIMQGNLQKGLFGRGYREGDLVDDKESDKDRKKRIKEMTKMLRESEESSRVATPDMGEYAPSMRENSRLNLMASPQGFVNPSQRNELMEMTQVNPMGRDNQMLGGSDTKGIMGRLGGSYNLDRDTTLSGGISGFAGRDRGEFTVKPSTVDLGIARRMGPGTLAAQYQRSLTGQQPPRYMANYSIPYAEGGISSLGGYSDGGRMLKGPGDGMSDDIPGIIGGKQPARLADGEFVVPADVVSHLGNGSTDAGAKRLYAMMDEVRRARTGNKKQGKKIKAEKYLPA